jgi:hypothetical protein
MTILSTTTARSVEPFVARFEELYAKKRSLEAEIEVTIEKIDVIARGNVQLAEGDLERTTLEGASFIARLERVRKGKVDGIITT